MADHPYADYHTSATTLRTRERTAAGSWVSVQLPEGTVLFDTTAVIAAVAAAFQLTTADVLGPLKHAHISEARDVCFWLLRRHSRLPLKALGAAMNRRDHSTPLRAVMRCEERRMRDAWFREVTDRLERELEEKAKGAAA